MTPDPRIAILERAKSSHSRTLLHLRRSATCRAPHARRDGGTRFRGGVLVTSTALEGTVLRSVAGPGSRDEWAIQEAQRYFSEGKARSIALLREAICTLEAEVPTHERRLGWRNGPKKSRRELNAMRSDTQPEDELADIKSDNARSRLG
jgi:hypothetical protein